jgi:hypothetical protein
VNRLFEQLILSLQPSIGRGKYVILFLLLVILILNNDALNDLIYIETKDASQIFGTISQVIATIVGLVLAVIIFRSQSFDQNRQSILERIRGNLNDIRDIRKAHPDYWNNRSEFISMISSLGKDDLDMQRSISIEMVRTTKQILQNALIVAIRFTSNNIIIDEEFKFMSDLHRSITKIWFNYISLEELTKTVDEERHIIIDMMELVVLTAVLLLMSLAFVTVDNGDRFPDIHIPITIGLSIFSVLSLIEFTIDVTKIFIRRV